MLKPVSLPENFMSKKSEPSKPRPLDIDLVTIAELTHAIEQFVSHSRRPGEGTMAIADELARRWKIKKHSWSGGYSNDLIKLLAALVVLLKPVYQLLERIRRRFPKDIENLNHATLEAELREFASVLSQGRPKLSPKKEYEKKRRRYKWNDVGEIEAQFGGARKVQAFSALDFDHPGPICLDDIFSGCGVSMRRLQELFDMDRHRFPKKLPWIKDGRKTLYDHRALLKIMDFLLSERALRRKRRVGRSPRKPWLNDRYVRRRVLNGIKERIQSISVPVHIKAAFLAVIRRHPDSGKK